MQRQFDIPIATAVQVETGGTRAGAASWYDATPRALMAAKENPVLTPPPLPPICSGDHEQQ